MFFLPFLTGILISSCGSDCTVKEVGAFRLGSFPLGPDVRRIASHSHGGYHAARADPVRSGMRRRFSERRPEGVHVQVNSRGSSPSQQPLPSWTVLQAVRGLHPKLPRLSPLVSDSSHPLLVLRWPPGRAAISLRRRFRKVPDSTRCLIHRKIFFPASGTVAVNRWRTVSCRVSRPGEKPPAARVRQKKF